MSVFVEMPDQENVCCVCGMKPDEEIVGSRRNVRTDETGWLYVCGFRCAYLLGRGDEREARKSS